MFQGFFLIQSLLEMKNVGFVRGASWASCVGMVGLSHFSMMSWATIALLHTLYEQVECVVQAGWRMHYPGSSSEAAVRLSEGSAQQGTVIVK